MAKRSKTHRRKPPRRQGTQVQKGLIILRRKGLIGNKEYRQAKPTKAARKLVRRYQDVIEGNATVVTPKTRLIPAHMRKALKERNGKLVVPKVAGTVSTNIVRTRRRVGKKMVHGIEIRRTRKSTSGKLIRELVATPMGEIPPLKPGTVYRVTMKNWGKERARYFSTNKAMTEFLDFYDNRLDSYADIAVVKLPKAFSDDA